MTEKGEFAEADAYLNEAEDIFRKNLSPSSLRLGDNLRNQAISLSGPEKYAEAIEKADAALKIYEEGFGRHFDNYPTALIIKGLSQVKTGQSAEGEKNLREAVRIRTESLPKENFWAAFAKSALGECLTIEKRYREAELLLTESYESLKTLQGGQNPRTLLAKSRLAWLYEKLNRAELAAQYP